MSAQIILTENVFPPISIVLQPCKCYGMCDSLPLLEMHVYYHSSELCRAMFILSATICFIYLYLVVEVEFRALHMLSKYSTNTLTVSPACLFICLFFMQDFTTQHRLAWNSQSFCLKGFPSTRITIVDHHVCL